MARAHSWRNLIESGKIATVTQLADKLQLDIAYVTKILHLVNLTPEIQEAIIAGNKPDDLSLNRLRRGIPVEWEKQRFSGQFADNFHFVNSQQSMEQFLFLACVSEFFQLAPISYQKN